MMFLRPHTPRLFTASGMALALLFLNIAWLGLAAFREGYWNDEPIAMGMFICSALGALWLVLGMWRGWLQCSIPRRNTLFNLWAAWMGWQALVTFFSPSPWRSWFGPPEQSEGLAWYICASLLMLLLAALWDRPRFKKIFLGYGFAMIFALAVCHLIADEKNNMFAGFLFPPIPENYFFSWLPFVWPDYLATMAAWWWIALLLTYRKLALKWLAALFMLMLVILIASSNHGAIVLISYAMLVTLVARLVPKLGLPYFTGVSSAWRHIATTALLLPLLWLFAAPLIPADYAGAESQSVPTRILLNHITLKALADEPSRLLLGPGWGRFADDFFRYGLVRDVRVYTNGVHAPNWPLIRGYNYHSHDMAGEILLSLGALGLLIWLMMPIVAVRRLPAEFFWGVVPMLVAARTLQHIWFVMPQTMPFQALCWMLLMKHTSSAPQTAARYRPMVAGLTVSAAALTWSANAQWEAMRYSHLWNDPFGEHYGKAFTAADIQEDIKRGGDRLRSFFINYSKRLSSNDEAIQAKHVALFKDYLASMEKLMNDPRTGAYNGAAILYGYNVAISSLHNPLFTELQKKIAADYFAAAKQHTRRAPYREDTIAPFLQAMWQAPSDREHHRLMAVVEELLAAYPAHRSALWLGGKVLSTQPGFEAQGLEMMRTALMLGADKVFLIPDADIKQLAQ